MAQYFVYPFIFLAFFSLNSFIDCSEVPIVVWNHKGTPLDIKPVSAFDKNANGLVNQLTEALNKDASILVFMMDRISLEDFTHESDARNGILKPLMSAFENEPITLLPSVKDPMKHIENLPCQPKDIFMKENSVEGKLSKDVIAALDRSCVVIVHVPDAVNNAKDYSADVRDLLMSIKKINKNVVGLLTGEKSSWMSQDRHRSRSVLAAVTKDDHFINHTGCIIFYAENVTLEVGGVHNESHTMGFPPKADGDCGNKTWLSLDFPGSGDVKSVKLLMHFEADPRTWRLVNSSVKITGGKLSHEELEMRAPTTMEAALGFSYACGDLVLRTKNSSFAISVVMRGFQIQPYRVNGVFSHSFNCVPWFTLPILMGILVALLFITILNFGIYALFNIKTMDRFDDPKGKTISVPTGND